MWQRGRRSRQSNAKGVAQPTLGRIGKRRGGRPPNAPAVAGLNPGDRDGTAPMPPCRRRSTATGWTRTYPPRGRRRLRAALGEAWMKHADSVLRGVWPGRLDFRVRV
jgi:hypothetical protein